MNCLLVILILTSFKIAFCVGCSPCNCTINEEKSIVALCSIENTKGQKLDYIPSTIPKNISVLHFNGQDFSVLKNNILSTFLHLKGFSIRRNFIQTIEPNAFKNLTKLNELWLNSNLLKTLPDGIFSDLQEIQTIRLEYNKITHLQKNLISDLPKLKTIIFWQNEIEVVEAGCFFNLPSLIDANLGNNKIKTLHPNIINMKSLQRFNLSGNPWHCDENLCELMQHIPDDALEKITCESPFNLKNTAWSQLPVLITNTTKVTSAVEGETVNIQCQHCFADKIIWNLNLTKIMKDFRIDIQNNNLVSSLIISNVSQNDAGFYSCYVGDCPTCEDVVRLDVNSDVKMTSTNFIHNNSTIIIVTITLIFIIITAIGSFIIYRKWIVLKRLQNTNSVQEQIHKQHNIRIAAIPLITLQEQEDDEGYLEPNNVQSHIYESID